MTPWLVQKIGPSAARAFMLRGGTTTGTKRRLGLLTDLVPRKNFQNPPTVWPINFWRSRSARTTKRYLNHLRGPIKM